MKKQLKVKCGCDSDHVCHICHNPEESENDVEKDIIEYCDHLPRCKVTKTSTTGRKKGKTWIKAQKSERKGKADLTLCYWGYYIEIEVKKPGQGKHGDDQKGQEKETLLAMGQYWLVDDLRQVIVNFKLFNLMKGIR